MISLSDTFCFRALVRLTFATHRHTSPSDKVLKSWNHSLPPPSTLPVGSSQQVQHENGLRDQGSHSALTHLLDLVTAIPELWLGRSGTVGTGSSRSCTITHIPWHLVMLVSPPVLSLRSPVGSLSFLILQFARAARAAATTL
jgi:hypothetical protein